ncbi:amino acid/amide ABC transporter membrane protein 1, HAAT family (TC 3.A.1.4.-) [Geosporobacter subterraneus DSM 17957]|uniref:Amino acid/amide ABC transporter membrane protein 1, HAAT family (TC 3.A.1.4.-) n=1 Tax=Geosporobacter subterraneus DSM 17957 TaxID=1121919 RepID=A0A1M6F854_9FIRM|nr:branched-chain amino acid ABC transporter permease [Geosporobacter subterraneus]SHI93875.1 amino acid/amide ABC transporter membrane protein 1, HAAT family (TC 3.A.1.4.-) [Geosporobacter subterraneus DSM 17957]
MSTFLQLLFSSLETGSVYALAALGIIIIFRTSKTTNFAQGSLGMFNAFVATIFLMSNNISPLVAAVVGMISAFTTGVVIDLIIMRRAKNISPLSKQIITFGLIMLLSGVAPMVFGTSPLSFPRFIQSGTLEMVSASITHNAFLNIGIGIAIMLSLFYFLQKTKWGLAVRVTASNEQTARLMGVPTKTVTMGAWAVAAALGTLSALMLAPAITVNISMMDNVQINALIACVLGGFQTFYGPVIGAYIIGLSKNMLVYYVSSTWGDAILYTLILGFMVFRPNGIIGKRIIKKV